MRQTALLSKDAEDKILDAISRVVDAVSDEKLSPTAAVVKVGQASAWPPDYVDRICQAYNTGRQESQRQAADDALSKFASFELADPAEVMRQLFPRHVAEPVKVAADYLNPPTWYTAEPDPTHREKAAAVWAKIQPVTVPAAPVEGLPQERMYQTYRHADSFRKQAEELRHGISVCEEHLLREVGNLRHYFEQGLHSRLPIGEVEKTAAVYFGDEATSLLSLLQSTIIRDERVKIAAAFSGRPVRLEEAPYSIIGRCIERGRDVIAARQKHAAYVAEKTPVVERMLSPYVGYTPIDGHPGLLPPEPFKAAGFFSGAAVGVGSGLANNIARGLPGSDTSDALVERRWRQLEDPSHENTLRAIRARAAITGLMANDEVIKGYSPEEVLDRYNELQAAMPNAVDQPLLLRTHLRRALQGNMEPFEAQQVLQTGTELSKQRAQTPLSQSLLNAPNSLLG